MHFIDILDGKLKRFCINIETIEYFFDDIQSSCDNDNSKEYILYIHLRSGDNLLLYYKTHKDMKKWKMILNDNIEKYELNKFN